jgi:hypothetical protein
LTAYPFQKRRFAQISAGKDNYLQFFFVRRILVGDETHRTMLCRKRKRLFPEGKIGNPILFAPSTLEKIFGTWERASCHGVVISSSRSDRTFKSPPSLCIAKSFLLVSSACGCIAFVALQREARRNPELSFREVTV